MTALHVPVVLRAFRRFARVRRKAGTVLAAVGAVLLVSGVLLLNGPASYATGNPGGTESPRCGCPSPSSSASPTASVSPSQGSSASATTSPSQGTSASATTSPSQGTSASATVSATVSASASSSQSPAAGRHHTKSVVPNAVLPTAVEAGLVSAPPAPARSGAAVGLIGAGAVLLAVSGWLVLWRRPRGVHES